MSIYKSFRDHSKRISDFNEISSRFDQPTYLSFKLLFAPRIEWYNDAAINTNYDRMPHPLFGPKGSEEIYERTHYSSVDYLLDANEFTRARMLEEFINKFNTLQNNFQWYFQKIDGINSLLTVDPEKGMRITSDKRLSITMLEGVDLRISHILNLYKKIAWDDTYQRWILPDMMRYFTLDIYVTEFRSFHVPYYTDGYGAATEKDNSGDELNLKVLDDIIPTRLIKCEMCEFDLESFKFESLSSLDVEKEPEEVEVTFDIKVGKIYEEQVYPMFYNKYLIDKYLNGFQRAIDIVPGGQLEPGVIGPPEQPVDFDSTTPWSGEYYLDPMYYGMVAQGLDLTEREHISGLPFNQMSNQKKLFGANAAGPDGKLFTEDDNIVKVDPTIPNTWENNAINFGNALVKNFANEVIDKTKITPIPGLGISFNEAQTALEAKNIIGALGLVRKGVGQVMRDYVQPSELLDSNTTDINIADQMFRVYLETIVKSQATTDLDKEIQRAANMVLTDDGVWGQLKDYSKATDLVAGKGSGIREVNDPNPIEGGTNYKDNALEEVQGDLSKATDLIGKGETNISNSVQLEKLIYGGEISEATEDSQTLTTNLQEGKKSGINKKISGTNIYEGIPTSQATIRKIDEG